LILNPGSRSRSDGLTLINPHSNDQLSLIGCAGRAAWAETDASVTTAAAVVRNSAFFTVHSPPRYNSAKRFDAGIASFRFLVALPPVSDLLLCAKHLFVCPAGGSNMSNGTSSAVTQGEDLASIPMAQGGLTRLAIARLKSAGVPVAPLLKRVGLTPELIAEPEERLNVRSQIALLNEAAIALKDDCIGFTLAREFDLREIGLIYYVMASSQTLGEGQPSPRR
jgi:hypothetical protein